MTLIQIKFLINIQFILLDDSKKVKDIQNFEVVKLIIKNHFNSFLDIHLESSAHI